MFVSKKQLPLLLTSFATLLVLSTSTAQAAVRCETQYGGGQVCVKTGQLQINKKVFNPSKNEWVDNLGLQSPHRFKPNEEVAFRLEVKNVGDAKLDKVTVTDTLPSQLELTSGSLSFEITDLDPGETESREVKAKVRGDKLNSMVECNIINIAEARSGNEYDKDTSQICAEKPGTSAKELPKAGPANWYVTLALSIVAGLTGLYIKRNSLKV